VSPLSNGEVNANATVVDFYSVTTLFASFGVFDAFEVDKGEASGTTRL